MSTCSNCYNGCTEIVSDRCVKYTGIDVPVLGIKTGDSLSFVEQALITFLVSTLDGSGVIIDLSGINVCTVVQKYLPTCKDLSIADISKALIEAACDLQVQVTANTNAIATLNADYTIGCLTGVTASSDTHAIVQAVINKLCALDTQFSTFVNFANGYFVNINNIDDYIQNYLDNVASASKMNVKMVPYAVLPFYAPSTYLSGKFDSTGAGLGDWDKIYLCNGLNNTPDLRGRVTVGVTDGTMLGLTMNAAVNPTTPVTPANPTYAVNTQTGSNQIALGINEMPSHSHTVTINDSTSHSHYMVVSASETTDNANSLYNGTNASRNDLALTSRAYDQGNDPFDYELTTSSGVANAGKTSDSGIHTHTNTVSTQGNGLPHLNIQPSSGCLYIQYRP